jgi:sulfur-oxidizing protein SoxX
MNKTMMAGVAAAVAVLGCAMAPTVSSDQVAAVYKRDFHTRGQAKVDRVVQDEVQKTCTDSDNNPSEALAKRLEAQEMMKIRFPSGSLMGDWKRGQKIAQSGRGMTWSDKPGAENGGSCYNCHQLSPEEDSYGTLGPSLRAFGKTRGYTPEMQKYAYGKIYNAKAYNLCSPMPRMGHSGTLTEQQMKDLTAYLMDPNSPVNK